MIRIVSDTSTLYSTAQAIEAGYEVSPLCVTGAGSTYRELDDISSKEFVDIMSAAFPGAYVEIFSSASPLLPRGAVQIIHS